MKCNNLNLNIQDFCYKQRKEILKKKIMAEYSSILQICLFADKDVGKKTLLKSLFVDNYYIAGVYISTIGVELCVKTIENRRGIRLLIRIVSDSEHFTSLWNAYVMGSHGVILMYDITRVHTLNRLSEWYQISQKYCESVPILLVGNKIDLEEEREVSTYQVEKFKQDYNVGSSMEISVMTGDNVEEMFLKVVSMCLDIELEELKAGVLEVKKQKLEKTREDLIWLIERALKHNKDKLQDNISLKDLRQLWSTTFFGNTTFFEEYIVEKIKRSINLAEYKDKLIIAKDLPELMNIWAEIQDLILITNFQRNG